MDVVSTSSTLAARMAAPAAQLWLRMGSSSQPGPTWTVQPPRVPTSPGTWEGLQPPKREALSTAACRVSSKAPVPKVLSGEAFGLLVRLLLHTSLQTLNLLMRNHDLLHHNQLPTSLDLPLMPCFCFAGSVVKARGAGT